MKTLEQYFRQTGMPNIREEVITAARYLEARGQRFMVHFGYENAIQKADALFESECDSLEVEQ